MNSHIRSQSLFNMGTQRALYERPNGYVSKEFYISEHIEELKRKHNLDTIVRLDLGQNNDGCEIKVAQNFEKFILRKKTRYYIKNYPEFVCRDLRQKIAGLHGIDKDWILLSAGLDQMLIMISSTFLEMNDKVMVNTPSFFLFEEYSKRMGAVPVWLKLQEEDGFKWTDETFRQYVNILRRLNPKIVWLANPNNPTGVSIPEEMVQPIIDEAARNFSFIIIDEAYGEYIDPFNGVNSASKYLHEYHNLLVLRTFSKCYGLANLRVGYAMCNDPDIFEALKIHRPYYPITQFSYDIAAEAMEHMDYLERTRIDVVARKKFLTDSLKQVPKVKFVKSDTGIIMLKHEDYYADELIEKLEKDGIIVAKLDCYIEEKNRYVRVTLGTEKELTLLAYSLSLL